MIGSLTVGWVSGSSVELHQQG